MARLAKANQLANGRRKAENEIKLRSLAAAANGAASLKMPAIAVAVGWPQRLGGVAASASRQRRGGESGVCWQSGKNGDRARLNVRRKSSVSNTRRLEAMKKYENINWRIPRRQQSNVIISNDAKK